MEMNSPKRLYNSSTVFSAGNYGDPRPPEVESDTLDTSMLDGDPDTTHLLLEMFIAELQEPKSSPKEEEPGVSEATPLDGDAVTSGIPSPISMTEVPPSTSLECMNSTNYNDPLDNPFLMEFTDLSKLLDMSTTDTTTNVIDPTLMSDVVSPVPSPIFQDATTTVNTSSTPNLRLFDLSECTHFLPHTTTISEVASDSSSPMSTTQEDFTLDLSCVSGDDLNTLLNSPDDISVDQLSLLLTQTQDQIDHSSVSSPVSVVDDSESQPEPQTTKKNRKRKVSESDSDCEDNTTQPKKSKKDKYLMRRQKNNEASRVSRAKRRKKHSDIFDRVTELEEENAGLRKEVENMEAETARLKKLLVERLSH